MNVFQRRRTSNERNSNDRYSNSIAAAAMNSTRTFLVDDDDDDDDVDDDKIHDKDDHTESNNSESLSSTSSPRLRRRFGSNNNHHRHGRRSRHKTKTIDATKPCHELLEEHLYRVWCATPLNVELDKNGKVCGFAHADTYVEFSFPPDSREAQHGANSVEDNCFLMASIQPMPATTAARAVCTALQDSLASDNSHTMELMEQCDAPSDDDDDNSSNNNNKDSTNATTTNSDDTVLDNNNNNNIQQSSTKAILFQKVSFASLLFDDDMEATLELFLQTALRLERSILQVTTDLDNERRRRDQQSRRRRRRRKKRLSPFAPRPWRNLLSRSSSTGSNNSNRSNNSNKSNNETKQDMNGSRCYEELLDDDVGAAATNGNSKREADADNVKDGTMTVCTVASDDKDDR